MTENNDQNELPPEETPSQELENPSDGKVEASSSALQMEVEQLRRELQETRDKYLRLMAESENRQKRLARDQRDSVRQAVADAVIDFLQPLDHMESALRFIESASEEVRNWARGFEMILNHFKDALATQGIIAFDSHGEVFDPHRHEAIEMVETQEHAEGVVVEEMHRGYEMEGRILRPARVKVAKAPTSPKDTKKETEREDESEA